MREALIIAKDKNGAGRIIQSVDSAAVVGVKYKEIRAAGHCESAVSIELWTSTGGRGKRNRLRRPNSPQGDSGKPKPTATRGRPRKT